MHFFFLNALYPIFWACLCCTLTSSSRISLTFSQFPCSIAVPVSPATSTSTNTYSLETKYKVGDKFNATNN